MSNRFTLTGTNDRPLHVDFLPETRVRLSTPQGAAILCPDGALLLTVLLERPDKFQGPRQHRLQIAVPAKKRRWWWPFLWYLPLPLLLLWAKLERTLR